MKKLSLADKLDRIALEASPDQLPLLLDRFQLAVKFRTALAEDVRLGRYNKRKAKEEAAKETAS